MTLDDSGIGDRSVRTPMGGYSADPPALWKAGLGIEQGDSAARRADLRGALRNRGHRADPLLFALVPVVLVGVFLLPAGVRRSLAFHYAEPTLFTSFTAHFVHLATGHLLANLAGYALLVTVLYLLSVLGDRRTRFLVVFVSVVTVFPFVLSALNLAVFRPRFAVGFSGINMALFGYLPFVLSDYLDTCTTADLGREPPVSLFFLGTAVIALLSLPFEPLVGAIALAALLACVLYLRPALAGLDRTDLLAVRAAAREPGHAELLVAGSAVFVAYPFLAFPADYAVGGAVVNVYTHQLGYSLAFIASYVALRSGVLTFESTTPP